jgi:hypothetical protein
MGADFGAQRARLGNIGDILSYCDSDTPTAMKIPVVNNVVGFAFVIA